MITGQAIAILGISPETLEDMSLREYFYALRIRMDHRKHQSRELYNIARLQATLIINFSGNVKTQITDPTTLVKFHWEKDQVLKIQSPDEMKIAVMSIAALHGAKVGTRKPDDPPTNWKPKDKK